MVVKQEVSGFVSVKFNSTHTNHNIQLAHLTLPKDVCLEIASKLQQGVKIDQILDSIRDTVGEKMA